jgi:hypothetical protein
MAILSLESEVMTMRALHLKPAKPEHHLAVRLSDLAFWLVVTAIFGGVGLLMWGTATNEY